MSETNGRGLFIEVRISGTPSQYEPLQKPLTPWVEISYQGILGETTRSITLRSLKGLKLIGTNRRRYEISSKDVEYFEGQYIFEGQYMYGKVVEFPYCLENVA